MKTIIEPTTTFTPASKTLDFSAYAGFDVKKLYAIINLDAATLIYAVASSGLGYSSLTGSVLTLQYNTVGMNAGDRLQIIYDDSTAVQVVSAASLPLPTGAATAAAQTSSGASLTSIDGKTPALGQALSAASSPVVLPAAQVTALTPPTIVTVQQPTGTNLHTVVDSSALPTGAATSAKQPALGTAGTPSGDVITVQGAASMTAIKVDGSAVTQPVSGTLTANPTLPSGFSSTGGSSPTTQLFNAPGSTKYLLVQADPANTDNIRFGSAGVSSTVGMVLAPGQDSGLIPYSSGGSVNVIPVTGTQKVNITWLF